MAKQIKVNNDTHKLLTKTSNITGISIGKIVDNLVKDKSEQDIVRNIIKKMKKH